MEELSPSFSLTASSQHSSKRQGEFARKLRGKHKSSWIREKRKRSNVAGKSYVSTRGKVIPARRMGPDCLCRRKCFIRVPWLLRLKIFDKFYSLSSHDEQNTYLFNLVRKTHDKTKAGIEKNAAQEPSDELSVMKKKRRDRFFKYYVKDFNGSQIQVCKDAFAAIHGISVNKVRTICNKINTNVTLPSDLRGKHNTRKRTPQSLVDEIVNHVRNVMDSPELIVKFSKGAEDGPKDCSALNITLMWRDFLSKSDPNYGQYVFLGNGKKVTSAQDPNRSLEPLAKHWLYTAIYHEVRTQHAQQNLSRLNAVTSWNCNGSKPQSTTSYTIPQARNEAKTVAVSESNVVSSKPEELSAADETLLPLEECDEETVTACLSGQMTVPSLTFGQSQSQGTAVHPMLLYTTTASSTDIQHLSFLETTLDGPTSAVFVQNSVSQTSGCMSTKSASSSSTTLTMNIPIEGSVVLPATIQGVGNVHLLVSANGQAQILGPCPIAPSIEPGSSSQISYTVPPFHSLGDNSTLDFFAQ